MSRGPGRHQRLVLAMVDAVTTAQGAPGWVTVDDVLFQEHAQTLRGNERDAWQRIDPSDREAVRRAMRTLAATGVVEAGDVERARYVRDRSGYQGRGWRRVLAVRRPWSDRDALQAAEAELARLEESLVSRSWGPAAGFMVGLRDDQAALVCDLRARLSVDGGGHVDTSVNA